MKIKCVRCGKSTDVVEAEEMSDTGLGDCFCLNCGIYFYKPIAPPNPVKDGESEKL